MTLDERKRKILQSIIKDYVETAEPVGSRAVVRKHDLKISAATVRNEMADLEDMGYLEQPHTSAGRIPSERGFRYYVDSMMENEDLTEQQLKALHDTLSHNVKDWDEVIARIAYFLSQITRYTSFIIVPSVHSSQFRYLQMIPLEEGKALVLLVTDLGLIMHRKIDVPTSVTAEDLEYIGQMFNRVFAARRLKEMRRSDLQSLKDELKTRREVIDKALEAIDLLLDNSHEERVIFSGILNMLNEPEFKDLEKLRRFLSLLEEENSFRTHLPQDVGEPVDIRIGKENPQDMQDMSLVMAGYKSFGELGKMGVIGPIRMEYWKAAGTVEAARAIIEEMVRKHF